tara:strand:+ start:1145 stop:2095 length:951 start_codon:yes stop_codon:yes gene_type:complete
MKDNFTNLVTGGAGFLGSNLIDNLMKNGEKVICVDNYISGNIRNILQWKYHPNFKLIRHNIIKPLNLDVAKIWHLACPASPVIFNKNPLEISKINYLGTLNMLELAKKVDAKILIASSSAIYGDPEIHPQTESYRGSVNSFGLRSCYEEGKRIAETLCYDFKRIYGCDIRIARIFNTYGPRMDPHDGRVVSNFITQSLMNKELTIYGDGSQTRSLCFVDDLIKGLSALMKSNCSQPINLGNIEELKIIDLANLIKNKINPDLKMSFKILPQNDPLRRRPSIEKAKNELHWEPKTSLNIGLDKTIQYFKNNFSELNK